MVFCICRGVRREPAVSLEGCLPTLPANAVNISPWQVLSWRRNHIQIFLKYFLLHGHWTVTPQGRSVSLKPHCCLILCVLWVHHDHKSNVWMRKHTSTDANSNLMFVTNPCVHVSAASMYPWSIPSSSIVSECVHEWGATEHGRIPDSRLQSKPHQQDILRRRLQPWVWFFWFGFRSIHPGRMKLYIWYIILKVANGPLFSSKS